jgi:ribonuclease HI
MLSYVQRETPKEDGKNLICFTDGACINNGRRHARGSYAVVWPEHPELNDAHVINDGQVATNNRAETMAVMHAITQADQLDPERSKTLIVYSDSMFVIKTICEWMPKWRKNGWLKYDGKVAANVDLLEQLVALVCRRQLVFRHVEAHTGKMDWESQMNDLADTLAKKALQNTPQNRNHPSRRFNH